MVYKKVMDDLEWHDFGLKKASKNSIVYPTLNSLAHEYVLVGTGCSNSYGQDQRISKRIVVASRYPFSILSVAGASSRKHSRTKRNSRSFHAMHGQ